MRERDERGLAIAPIDGGSGIDRLADAASRRPVPPGRDAESVIREALIVGRARARTAARRRALAASAVVGLAAAAALAISLAPRPRDPIAVAAPAGRSEGEAEAEPVALALPASHRAVALPGSELALERAGEGGTVLRLGAGAALFDVAPLGERGRFEVRTPDATVRVRGTVFAVTVRDGRTRVDVFEGRVEALDARGGRALGAGASYATDASLVTPPSLIVAGERAARARAAVAAAGSEPASAAGVAVPGGESVPRAAGVGAGAVRGGEAAADLGAADVPGSSHGSGVDGARVDALPVDLERLRTMCDRGEFAEALSALGAGTPPPAERGEWALIEGDAHRALGHVDAAADAYERAASLLTPTRAALAGFLAATQRERAGDPARALEVLDRAHAAERGSPLEERALAMRASLLSRLGRRDEARTAARAYLASYPGGEAIARMEALLAR